MGFVAILNKREMELSLELGSISLNKLKKDNNMICYENVNIYEVNKREGEYNDKKKKYIKFAKPKITKKLIFEDCYSSLEELSNEIRHAVMRGSGDRIEVSFEAKMEY